MVPAGGTATFKAPSAAGSYAFHCTIHPFMHGKLVVSA
jgi:plastocyanin